MYRARTDDDEKAVIFALDYLYGSLATSNDGVEGLSSSWNLSIEQRWGNEWIITENWSSQN